MKNKIKRIVYVLLCLVMVLSITGCGDEQTEEIASTNKKSHVADTTFVTGTSFSIGAPDSDTGMIPVAENDQFKMVIDDKSMTVGVYAKETGYLWKTNLTEDELSSVTNEETRNQYMSQLLITYYDSSNAKVIYDSYKYAIVDNTQYNPTVKLFNLENGVRVVYKIGENIDEFLFPAALTEEVYNEIHKKMEDKIASGEFNEEDIGNFESYFNYNIYDEIADEQKGSFLNTYKILSDSNPINIYTSMSMSRLNKIEFVNHVLKPLGYDQKWLEDFYTNTIKYSYTVPEAPTFTVPIDYTLTEDGLSVNVPADEIEFKTDSFRLNNIQVLPFFGCTTKGTDGYMLLPDGSGSIIDINKFSKDSISMPFYGPDRSLRTKDYALNMQQATLPTFGIHYTNETADNGFVAYISDGEAIGAVECHPKNDVFPFSYIGTTYEIHSFETFKSEGMSRSAELQKYASDRYYGDITLDYYFLTGENSDYVGMAKTIRDRIFKDSEKIQSDETKFYMETYGEVLRVENFIGYAYNANRALTTAEQAGQLFTTLTENGVKNIALRYNNWYGDKYENSLSNIGSVAGTVGSKSDFKALAEKITSAGGVFYPNIELVLDEETASLTASSWHSKLIEGTLAKYSGNDTIYQEGITVPFKRTIVKSNEIVRRVSGILEDCSDISTGAFSMSTVGSHLFSDYGSSSLRLRDEVKDDMVSLLKTVSESNKIMIDIGNAYALPYVDDVVDIPLNDSLLLFEEESVPFFQIVVHGYVSYAGSSMNLSDNHEMTLLKSIEYGAGVRYVLNYAEQTMLKNTNYSTLYSTNYARWIDTAATDYKTVSSALNGVQSSLISDHEKLADDVYMTTYENGTSVVVNYTSQVYTHNGTQVPQKSFAVVK